MKDVIEFLLENWVSNLLNIGIMFAFATYGSFRSLRRTKKAVNLPVEKTLVMSLKKPETYKSMLFLLMLYSIYLVYWYKGKI